ncbi:MAG: YeeE/YedE thiosulfate transporter family protein [Deltaproteobacteria bacterium]|nr:YeeE/YedE thiosulfate transporter family protein [Deltaproteobacteria bacterium]
MSIVENVTWGRGLLGGVLIGTSTSLLLVVNGRVAGISGIVGGLINPVMGERTWRSVFVLGLLLGGTIAALFMPDAIVRPRISLAVLIFAGLLVGAGTRLANGCTSGHGVCGNSRLSTRSMAATMTFIGAGAVSVLLARMLQGGAS